MTDQLKKLRAQADHPDTDCVAYVDEIVPALLDVAEAAQTMREAYRLDEHLDLTAKALATALEQLKALA